jgi:hypothetical protein
MIRLKQSTPHSLAESLRNVRVDDQLASRLNERRTKRLLLKAQRTLFPISEE